MKKKKKRKALVGTLAPKKNLTPLCIRFKPADRDRIHAFAKYDGKKQSVWVRETLTERANRVLSAKTWAKGLLRYETAHGSGKQFCIRFQIDDYDRVRLAAAREGAVPSTWIRAVLVDRLDNEPMQRMPSPKKRRVKEARAT